MDLGKSQSKMSGPLKAEVRSVRRVLVQQTQDMVREVGRSAAGARFTFRKAKADEVDAILGADGGVAAILKALGRLSEGWSPADESGPPVFQHGTTVLGPLGVMVSQEERRANDVNSLVRWLLLDALTEQHLVAVAKSIDPASVTPIVGERSESKRRLGLAQIALCGSDSSLAQHIGDAIVRHGPLQQDAMAPWEIGRWVVTPYGLLVTTKEPPEVAIAGLLVSHESDRLQARVEAFASASGLGPMGLADRYAAYVVSRAPSEVLSEALSPDAQWRVLQARGLRLPHSISPEGLSTLLLRSVGLSSIGRPVGLHRLYDDVRHPRTMPVSNDSGLSLGMLKSFETAYERSFVALVACALERPEEAIGDWLGDTGPALFGESWPKGARSIRRSTLGQKTVLFRGVLDALESSTEAVASLERVGRRFDELRAAFVDGVVDVLKLRNRIAHDPDDRVPATEEIRVAIKHALEQLVVGGDRGAVAPMFVRVVRESIDHARWHLAHLEDELGNSLQCSTEGDFDLGCHYALVALPGHHLSRPFMVPLQTATRW